MTTTTPPVFPLEDLRATLATWGADPCPEYDIRWVHIHFDRIEIGYEHSDGSTWSEITPVLWS